MNLGIAEIEIATGYKFADQAWEQTGKYKIPAYTKGPFAFHPYDDGPEGTGGQWWSITHIPTGWHIAEFPDIADALGFCDDVAQLDWWNLKAGKVPTAMKIPVKRAIKAHNGW